MPHSHTPPFHQAAMSLVWGMGSLLLVVLGAFVSALLPLPANQWPLAWLFETPVIFTALQAITRGYAAREQATMQREYTLSAAGLFAGYLACILAVLAAVSFSFFIQAAVCRPLCSIRD